jgi:hypothetical protein
LFASDADLSSRMSVACIPCSCCCSTLAFAVLACSWFSARSLSVSIHHACTHHTHTLSLFCIVYDCGSSILCYDSSPRRPTTPRTRFASTRLCASSFSGTHISVSRVPRPCTQTPLILVKDSNNSCSSKKCITKKNSTRKSGHNEANASWTRAWRRLRNFRPVSISSVIRRCNAGTERNFNYSFLAPPCEEKATNR